MVSHAVWHARDRQIQAGCSHATRRQYGDNKTTLFLDIEDKVESADWEQGLLGLAFDPDFKNNGVFFVTYTLPGDTLRLSKFVEDNETVLLEIEQPYVNHNGGHIVFGPDGYLYVVFTRLCCYGSHP